MILKDFEKFLKVGDIITINLGLSNGLIKGVVMDIDDMKIILNNHWADEKCSIGWEEQLISLSFLYKQI